MKVNLKRNINVSSCLEKVEFFKEFSIYKTIKCDEFIYMKEFLGNKCYILKNKLTISKVEATIPSLEIIFSKLIETIEGTTLEGQSLSGKKLILVGKINFKLIICYHCKNELKYSIKNINMPFSTFIILPKDICKLGSVNLRYEIEDLSIVYLWKNKILISVIPLIQYTDEYLGDKSLKG